MIMVVRTDLNMGKGKIAAQCAHAAVDLYDLLLHKQDPQIKKWVTKHYSTVIFESFNLFLCRKI